MPVAIYSGWIISLKTERAKYEDTRRFSTNNYFEQTLLAKYSIEYFQTIE